MKINIFYELRQGPYGGANQFLKLLKDEFRNLHVYEEDPSKADVILFIAHHKIKEVYKLKYKFPSKIFVHRIDGPTSLVREDDLKLDRRIFQINYLVADGTVFQSEWSRRENYLMGFKKRGFETIIMNASDNLIFYPKDNSMDKNENNKCRLIATSWSKNMNKGFDLYKYLDENLDFSKYSMIFVGNSPVSFKNIKQIEPVGSYDLAELLRKCDIYITGSKSDPCSNSLIEALSCGVPSIVLNDGGHPDILKKGGETFDTFEECIDKIELIRKNYDKYRSQIQIPSIKDISNLYLQFIESILYSCGVGYRPKQINKFNLYKNLLKNASSKKEALLIVRKMFTR